VSTTSVEEKIIRILRISPPGLSITALSRKLKMNRNSVSWHLSLLEAQGTIESRTIGQSRIYFLPHKLSVSALLDLSTDLVCTFDHIQYLTFANTRFLDFFGLDENQVFYQHIADIQILNSNNIELSSLFSDVQFDKEGISEIVVDKEGRRFYFKAKSIPTQFEDKTVGTTILLEDVTEEKKHLKNLEFLAKTSAELADLRDDDDIYNYIADRLCELETKAHIIVASIDPETRQFKVKSLSGNEEMTSAILTYFVNIKDIDFQMDNVPYAWDILSAGNLVEGPESAYTQVFYHFPEDLCNKFQHETKMKKHYTIGCTCRGGLYGDVALRYRVGDDIENAETVFAFVRQAGIALQRRHIKKKLQNAEELLKNLDCNSKS